ncbi:hypothetical protein K461DRAFT_269097 [Myriangium duriaei CBS 260.36]|uniref:Uncharacterized protein n=1 Tax=Myriangium duriaei CBS 260.36 TaxID=1168546 RepID=A0A9P4MLT0_9PEZI|nr:hypothetical protein K461DRAFT_269097 [Myriangium duriaei CBS 260.36]
MQCRGREESEERDGESRGICNNEPSGRGCDSDKKAWTSDKGAKSGSDPATRLFWSWRWAGLEEEEGRGSSEQQQGQEGRRVRKTKRRRGRTGLGHGHGHDTSSGGSRVPLAPGPASRALFCRSHLGSSRPLSLSCSFGNPFTGGQLSLGLIHGSSLALFICYNLTEELRHRTHALAAEARLIDHMTWICLIQSVTGDRTPSSGRTASHVTRASGVTCQVRHSHTSASAGRRKPKSRPLFIDWVLRQ